MAVPHYTYMVLKMPGPNGIITVKGSFKLFDICDKEFHKMAQTFGMIVEYGQLNGKVEGNHNRYKATQRRPRRARSKETSSPSVRTKKNLQQMSQGLLQPKQQSLKSN
jgi:hypothetical protein